MITGDRGPDHINATARLFGAGSLEAVFGEGFQAVTPGRIHRHRTPVEDYVVTSLHGGAMVTRMTSRQFNQDTSGAKKAAESGPVYITDRGRPAHVLLTFDAYQQLLGPDRLLDLLGEPEGVADVQFSAPTQADVARPAEFD